MAWVNIEVNLDEVSDEDIKDEFYSRNLGGGAEDWDEHAELEKAHRLHHQGKVGDAYAILWKMCLIKLNKIV